MALAGFVYYPDSEAIDKVMCAYCGLELGQWEEYDDPSLAHHDASPGCSFWRKSSSGAPPPQPAPPSPTQYSSTPGWLLTRKGCGVGGCVGVWKCGCVGVWVCGCVGVWVCVVGVVVSLCGCVGVWVWL
ncbi:hypothetical protein T484DRAFT_2635162 [Baffinella frigidus]|nr:hypothetical protein T484DRAFT_2635162 [Cryptophyta sp. CCMP2293]